MPRRGSRRIAAAVLSSAAILVVWIALLVPDGFAPLTLPTFLRLPLEGIVIAAILLALPRRAVVPVSVVLGVLLAALTLIKALDGAVGAQLGRPFDPSSDIGQINAGAGVVGDAFGLSPTVVIAAAIVALVLCVALLVVAVTRLARVIRARPKVSLRVLTGLTAIWVTLALVGVSVASHDDATLAAATTQRTARSIAAARSFDTAVHSESSYASTPASVQLGKLAGKDVLIVFVESYGQTAVQRSTFAPGVDAALATNTAKLTAAGFSARSGWLTSPTFGGVSWLAHSTLQSGLWVTDNPSYDSLLQTKRLTISQEFGAAGWRTVSDIPSDAGAWPAGEHFYGFDAMYNASNVGYAGPKFSYAKIPDQYTLAKFAQLELGPKHKPVMGELDLVSSHTPWTPLPHLVPDNEVGNGSIYDSMPAQGLTPAVAWRNPATVQKLYGESIQYSIDALTNFITSLNDKNLVVLMLGDHQPANEVSGMKANHQVPISLISANTGVLDDIDAWHWSDGLRPAVGAPLWRMDAFRNRFFDAFHD